MFRNRQSTQKPSDELFERFRQSFPDVRLATTSAPPNQHQDPAVAPGGLQDSNLNQPRFTQDHVDLDPTPRAGAESFRFTPSLTPSAFMDPTSSAFAAFANQPAGLFTPTPGPNTTGINGESSSITLPVTTQHDLSHHSNIGISLDAPLSMGNSTTLPPAIAGDSEGYGPPQQFQTYQFGASMHPQYLDPSQYGLPDGPGSPMDMSGHDLGLQSLPMGEMSIPSTMPIEEKKFDQLSHLDLLPTSERFRFGVVLNAPTAMIKHPEEIPVTYLNKGQAYAISVVDSAPPPRDVGPLRYRTFIRISFHDETQRNRPAGCWQLWKEGRGMNEAHQRGGKLQAVEYVEVLSSGDDDKRPKMELESSSFDGFSVLWSPPPTGPAETAVSVRFNFLSTDFSHSKGVKGIPVRLCAKTELLSDGSPRSTIDNPEVCYCKVKLFRDHGAERKLANDILHVKKTIEKLKQQAGQSDVGMKLYGKKSKSNKEEEMSKPGKVQKHKRTWSVSSASSVGGPRAVEEDINAKLQSMQDMFSSTRPISVLYLRGDEQDDPDLHPVRIVGENPSGGDQWARRNSVATTGTNSTFASPSPSSKSSLQRGDSLSPEKDWEGRVYRPSGPSGAPMRVKTNSEDGVLSGWIEAIGIDSAYKPPSERPWKAVMCVYIMPIVPGEPENPYYRAVYLESRTAASLTSSIASKCGIDSNAVYRVSHVNAKGVSIFVDDDFVQQMDEGQDMKVQLREIAAESNFSSPSDNWSHSTSRSPEAPSKKWELSLIY